MKNEYEIRGDITAIIINSKKYGRLEALISTNKLERAKEFPNSWCARFDPKLESCYVTGTTYNGVVKDKTKILHRWITNAPNGSVVDHVNQITLDNTDNNLRIITHGENMQNRKVKRTNNKSGVRGVHWYKNYSKWVAQIRVEKTKIHLGYFEDIKEAEKAVKEARRKHMPYSQEALAN